jgi:hypothetical protein
VYFSGKRMAEIRFMVLSDMHADRMESGDTYVQIGTENEIHGRQPFEDLVRFVNSNLIRVDVILCPGDICNKSSEDGRQYAWKKLHDVAKLTQARSVISTPGNHDLVTSIPMTDCAMPLKTLDPSFPTGDLDRDTEFWKLGFTIIEEDDFRILVLNSCHGFPPHPGNDATADQLAGYRQALNRGSFDELVQKNLEEGLQGLTFKSVNIAIMHHHPEEHEYHELFKDHSGPMIRGEELLNVLKSHRGVGRWFVLHGHKHIPRLLPMSGDSANSPVIMGAASLGARLWPPVDTVTRNQFHIVTFDLDHNEQLPPLRGRVQSYMWGYGSGWILSGQKNVGLPPLCGFGAPIDHRVLAANVKAFLDSIGAPTVPWDDVVAGNPELDYQGPTDFEDFEDELNNRGWTLVRHRSAEVALATRIGG